MPDVAPVRCPQCEGPLEVATLHCPRCDLTVSGSFRRCRFCELAPEQLELLEVFVRCRGVIRQMEKELGVSYPTVRARVDDLLVALGFEGQEAKGETIRSILERLERGELGPDEAAGRIRNLKGGR
jgi:hypothetical protein